MCFGRSSYPEPQTNPAPYSLEQSHTAVKAEVRPATAEELPKPPAGPAPTPVRNRETGLTFYNS